MATSNSRTPKTRSKSAALKASHATSLRRRASQRARSVELELGYPGKLRPLMIEQSRTEEGGYITVYAGVRGEFLAADVPPHLIPAEGSVEFEIRRRLDAQLLRATMSLISVGRWELEIDWGDEVPREDGHPAICELARMISIDLGYWYSGPVLSAPDLEQPIKELLADERAVDFRPSKDAPRLQISAGFYAQLSAIARQAYLQVHAYGEVFPVPAQVKAVEPKRKESPVRLAVDNTVRL